MGDSIADVLQKIVDLGWDIEVARELFDKKIYYIKVFTRDKRKSISDFTYRISCYKGEIIESDLIAMLNECLEKIKEIENISLVK